MCNMGVPTRDDRQAIAERLGESERCIQVIANDRKTAAMTVHAEKEERDDLKMINGIGPVLEGKLNATGFCAYRQIANLTDTDVNSVDAEVIHLSGRMHPRRLDRPNLRCYTLENTGTEHPNA